MDKFFITNMLNEKERGTKFWESEGYVRFTTFFFSISTLAQVTATPETRNILRHHAPDRKQLFLNLRFQTEDAQFFRQPKQYYEEILEKDPSTFEQMMKIPFILSKGWLNCKPVELEFALLFLARVPP